MTFNCAHSNFPVARMAGFDSDPWPVARNGLCPERAPKDNAGRPDWRVAGLMAIAGIAVRSKLAKRVTSLVLQLTGCPDQDATRRIARSRWEKRPC
jgi:hypothetical protein